MGTKQDFITYLERIQTKYYYDPVGFTRDILKVEPTIQQIEIMNAVVKHKKVSVRSGHNIGKSGLASFLTWWFETTRSHPKVICSATTREQLYDVLWAEIAKWKRRDPILDACFEHTHDMLFFKGYPNTWWAAARTANKQEGIAGRHSNNQMLIFDEVSGMDDDILEASEGLMSGKNVYVLMISNPTRPSGYFYETQMNPKLRKHWHPMKYSSLDSPLADPAWLEYMLDKYGKDSPVYMVRVLGEFPIDSENTLIPRSWVLDAVDREFVIDRHAPRILGVDVGAGGDQSVIAHRQGGVCDRIVRFNTADTMKLVGLIAKEYTDYNASAICIDNIGIGKGAFDRLRERRFNVYAVDVRRNAPVPGYDKVSDWLWWTMRESFEAGTIAIPNDHDLQLELWSVKYEPGSGDEIKVEKKKEMKKRIKYSPDSAEALRNTYFLDDNSFFGSDEDDEEEETKQQKLVYNKSTGY